MNILKKSQRYIDKIQCKFDPVKFARKKGVKIGEGTKIYSSDIGMFSTEPWLIKIGTNVHITHGVRFITHDGGTLVIKPEEYESTSFVLCGDIVVGNNVYIGENSIILPGTSIGDNVIIGAGSIVTKDIPSNCIAAGVPCKKINSRESYIKKIRDVLDGKNTKYYKDLDYMHSLNPKKTLWILKTCYSILLYDTMVT